MIRKAVIKDLDAIMEIIRHIIVEMHRHNNFQWDENYPQVKDFTADIAKGELFVSIREGNVVGFICINNNQPIEYKDVKWSLTENALVIHRMGVDPSIRNAGVGLEIVGFAEKLSKKIGVSYLKTDTYSLNVKAQRLFQKCGFVLVGGMSFLGKEKPFYCYEKILYKKRILWD